MQTPRVWFITGCSSGIGRALAERVLEVGDHLIATARNVATLEDLVAGQPDRCKAFELDVIQAGSIPEIIKQAVEVWGRIDVLINNAGCGLLGALEETTDTEMQRCFETNFFGPVRLMRAVLPIMRQQGSGHIINISAAAAVANYPGFSMYGGAKAAMELASESLRQEVAPFGINVTLVEPGPFRTEFGARSMQKVGQGTSDYQSTVGKFSELLERINGRQPGDPQKAAAAIVQMVQDSKAPLRLPLGKYILNKIKMKNASTLRELSEWESVAAGVEF